MSYEVELYPHQKEALTKLKNGSILCGGVGSGKSLTAVSYFFKNCCGGHVKNDLLVVDRPMDLYIITTAKKRDSLEWDKECLNYLLSTDREKSIANIKVTVDSWNNIGKYVGIKDAFFIFDEQRVVGSGAWVKSFLKITKLNQWILLSATPGDTWMAYIPVFIANGFYRNRTEFIRRHCVYNRYSKYPKIDRYLEVPHLMRLKESVLVNMPYKKHTEKHIEDIEVEYDKELMEFIIKKRWNVFYSKPIKNIAEMCYLARKVCNSDLSRLEKVKEIIEDKKRVIIFYNFDYELYILRTLAKIDGLEVAEWNGHKHEKIPTSEKWAYLVNYSSGAEGWNCIETNTIIFYSQNYSYAVTLQASGRIDRLNTPFENLYYYNLKSKSSIDLSIARALKNKKKFNENSFSVKF